MYCKNGQYLCVWKCYTSYAVHCAHGKKIKTSEWHVRASVYLKPTII